MLVVVVFVCFFCCLCNLAAKSSKVGLFMRYNKAATILADLCPKWRSFVRRPNGKRERERDSKCVAVITAAASVCVFMVLNVQQRRRRPSPHRQLLPSVLRANRR